MRRPLIKNIALILALVISQWLVFAHAVSHPALTLDANCQFCIHAPGLDSGALAGTPAALPQAAAVETPQPAVVRAAAIAPQQRIRIRGPPSILA
ncbi:hypothetical protein AAG565_09005 [Fontimonas sp. SYSU GA230001]|uniref:hypothetical protein n=1 Tax=Fontimonas sp. SYSU GA230001 TaxID=3142450 RepID=UPI0032B488E4